MHVLLLVEGWLMHVGSEGWEVHEQGHPTYVHLLALASYSSAKIWIHKKQMSDDEFLLKIFFASCLELKESSKFCNKE